MLRLKSVRQNWAKKFKEYYLDYKSSFAGTLEAAKARPIRASLYAGSTITAYVAYKTTPCEAKYIASLVESSDDMLLCGGEKSRRTEEYLQNILKQWSKGMLRYRNAGLFSIMYSAEHCKDTKAYNATCKYTNPRWFELKDHVIDVGFFGKWWTLSYAMTNYDVDFDEIPKEYKNMLEKFYDLIRTAFGYSYYGDLKGQPKRTILYVETSVNNSLE